MSDPAIFAPKGVWDGSGYWHPDPCSDLSPAEQKAWNEDHGRTCTQRPSSATGAFDA